MTIFYVDTETDLISAGCTVPPLVCLQVAQDDGAPSVHDTDTTRDVWRSIVEACVADPASIVVGHNLTGFDLLVLANETNTLSQCFLLLQRNQIRDTQVRKRLLDIADGNDKASASLESCAWQYLGARVDGKRPPKGALEDVLAGDMSRLYELPPRYRFGQLRGVPLDQWPADFIEYAKDDIILTRDVYKAQGGGVLVDEPQQCRAAFALALTTAWGIRTDSEAVERLATEVGAEHKALENQLADMGVIKISYVKDNVRAQEFVVDVLGDAARRNKYDQVITSIKALREAVAEIYGPPDVGEDEETLFRDALLAEGVWTEKRTKDTAAIQALVLGALGDSAPRTDAGGVQVDKDALKAAKESATVGGNKQAARVLSALIAISKTAKVLNTYIPVLRSGTVRPINARYHVLKASGRTSSSNPNIQNLPRKGGVRECFIPRPGKVFIQADWSSAEMVALAYINDLWGHGDAMKRAINAGIDPHLLFASQLDGRPYEEIKTAFDAGEQWAIDLRQFCKIANFGYPGGMGAASFVDYAAQFGVEIDLETSTKLRRTFSETWPEMVHYFAKVASMTQGGSCDVVQVGSSRVRGGARYTQACNTYFQGLLADFAKWALWNIALACYKNVTSPLYGWRLVAFIHDEFILEGDPDTAPAALEELKRIMIKACERAMPGMVGRVEGKIMVRWSK